MQKLLPVLLAILFLTACAQNPVELSEENETTDNFERNLKCLKLRDEVKAIIKDHKEKDPNAKHAKYSLEEIFYSPKENTCLYVESRVVEAMDKATKSLWNISSIGPNTTSLEFCYLSQSGGCNEFDKKIKGEYQN